MYLRNTCEARDNPKGRTLNCYTRPMKVKLKKHLHSGDVEIQLCDSQHEQLLITLTYEKGGLSGTNSVLSNLQWDGKQSSFFQTKYVEWNLSTSTFVVCLTSCDCALLFCVPLINYPV